MFDELLQNHGEKIGCDAICLFIISVASQSLDGNDLRGSPTKGRIPLTTADVDTCEQPAGSFKKMKVRYHPRRLPLISDADPQRVRSSYKLIAPNLLLNEVIIVIKTVLFIPH